MDVLALERHFLEPGKLEGQRVGADRKQGKTEIAVFIRYDASQTLKIRAFRGDGDAGKGFSLLFCDFPPDLACLLGPKVPEEQNKKKKS